MSSTSGSAKDSAKLLEDILNELRAKKPDPPGLTWLEGFLPSVIVLSSFGGSITFTVIPSQNQSPDSRFNPQNVRNYLALAWLFFVLALGAASTAQMVLTFHRPTVKAGFEKRPYRKWKKDVKDPGRWDFAVVRMFCWFPLSLLLQMLVLLAFLFLSFVVFAYAPAVGSVALGFTGLSTIGVVVLWALHTFN
jgi:hypothetical protein